MVKACDLIRKNEDGIRYPAPTNTHNNNKLDDDQCTEKTSDLG